MVFSAKAQKELMQQTDTSIVQAGSLLNILYADRMNFKKKIRKQFTSYFLTSFTFTARSPRRNHRRHRRKILHERSQSSRRNF